MSSPLASLERVLRIGVAVLALAVAILANVRAHAAPSLVWKLAHDVPAVTIERDPKVPVPIMTASVSPYLKPIRL